MTPDVVASQPNAILAAVAWLQSVFVESVATVIAIIAVGWFGVMLMTGRVSIGRGTRLIFGCFIIFGASTIAAGIVRGLTSIGPEPEVVSLQPAPLIAPVAAERSSRTVPYDPYAGAAMPPRR